MKRKTNFSVKDSYNKLLNINLLYLFRLLQRVLCSISTVSSRQNPHIYYNEVSNVYVNMHIHTILYTLIYSYTIIIAYTFDS